MTPAAFVLGLLACACGVTASVRLGPVTVVKGSTDAEPKLFQHQRSNVCCNALHGCPPAFDCDPRTSQCVAKQGECVLLDGGSIDANGATPANWRDGGCFSANGVYFSEGACHILVDGVIVSGHWRNEGCFPSA